MAEIYGKDNLYEVGASLTTATPLTGGDTCEGIAVEAGGTLTLNFAGGGSFDMGTVSKGFHTVGWKLVGFTGTATCKRID